MVTGSGQNLTSMCRCRVCPGLKVCGALSYSVLSHTNGVYSDHLKAEALVAQ